MHLYVKSTLSFEEVADLVAASALPGFERERRDGLHRGGGEYFKFSRDGVEVLLVSNEDDHAEVFVPSKAAFPYYCYVWRGPRGVLDGMRASLSASGIDCELSVEA